jgi:hypothetical protein
MVTLVLRGALVAIVLAATIDQLARETRRARKQRHKDRLLDLSLEETFPASDPPASQYFSTPSNRREWRQ